MVKLNVKIPVVYLVILILLFFKKLILPYNLDILQEHLFESDNINIIRDEILYAYDNKCDYFQILLKKKVKLALLQYRCSDIEDTNWEIDNIDIKIKMYEKQKKELMMIRPYL